MSAGIVNLHYLPPLCTAHRMARKSLNYLPNSQNCNKEDDRIKAREIYTQDKELMIISQLLNKISKVIELVDLNYYLFL